MPQPSFIMRWATRMDGLFIFTPERWPHRERIARGTALLIISAFVLIRIVNFDRFPQFFEDARLFYSAIMTSARTPVYGTMEIYLLWGAKLLVWTIETAIYLGYIASYASRTRAVGIARGALEVAFPIMVAGIPVLISLLPYSLPRWLPFASACHLAFYLAIMGLIVVGGIINLVGLLTMRQAFTIMSEARTLVTTGIFRYVRHPLYTGHFIMFFGSMLLRLQWTSIMLYGLFVLGQLYRARIEERKLAQAFEGYARYKNRTGMFIPRLTRDK
jgi:protein-S-isoprenylcysteine O-methyltransferase Ste14